VSSRGGRMLRPEDFNRKIFIRGKEHSIVQAINRQMTHYAYHVGQIVFSRNTSARPSGNQSAFHATDRLSSVTT